MNITKVHVKTRPSLTNNAIHEKPDLTAFVRRLIPLAARLRNTMLMAAAGHVSHIDPTGAQAFVDATVDLYSELNQRHHDIVERDGQADRFDVLLIHLLFSKLDEHLDSLQRLPKGRA